MVTTAVSLKGLGLQTGIHLYIQNMILNVFKCLNFDKYPGDLKKMFSLSPSSYSLRGSDILSVFKVNTTSYGLHSFSYLSAKCWNVLPDNYRTAVEFNHTSAN